MNTDVRGGECISSTSEREKRVDTAIGEMGISHRTACCYKMLRCVGFVRLMACMYSSVLLLVKTAQIPWSGLVSIVNNHIHCDSA